MDVDELIKKISEISQVRYWRYVAYPVNNSCEKCLLLNGQIFRDDDPNKPRLPMHENCGCRLVEIFPPEARLEVESPSIQPENLKPIGILPAEDYINDEPVFVIDKEGRVIKAKKRLKIDPQKRNRHNQKIAAKMGKPGDEGGHLIPARYGGSGTLINHLPQSRNANRSLIKKIENEMGRALEQNKQVEYTVIPHYPDKTTRRPDSFKIRSVIDGVEKEWRIPND